MLRYFISHYVMFCYNITLCYVMLHYVTLHLNVMATMVSTVTTVTVVTTVTMVTMVIMVTMVTTCVSSSLTMP